MDLKGTTSLDPKLKEAYEKVMGTSFTPTPAPAAQPEPQAPAQQPAPPQPAATVPTSQAPLQPPPVQPLHVTEVAPEEQPQPAQPLPVTPAPQTAANDIPATQEMVASPQIFSNANPFQETTPPPGEVIAKNAVVTPGKNNKIVVIGLSVGGAVFFAVYAFIWAKVFGLF